MYIFYHKPIICCAIRLTAEIATQQQAPKARAEPPDFNNFYNICIKANCYHGHCNKVFGNCFEDTQELNIYISIG